MIFSNSIEPCICKLLDWRLSLFFLGPQPQSLGDFWSSHSSWLWGYYTLQHRITASRGWANEIKSDWDVQLFSHSLSILFYSFFGNEHKRYQFWYQLFWFAHFLSSSRPPSTFLCCSSCGAAVVGLRPELSDSSAGHCTIGLFFPLCATNLCFLTLLVHFRSLFLSPSVHYWSLSF